MARPDAEMERIAAAARAGATRSALYRWMAERHDDFARLMAETRPNWRALTDGFTELGIVMADGKPLHPKVVRQTWWRVRRAVKARARVPARPPPPVVAPVETAPDRPVSDADAAMADIRRQMNERSGRKA